MFVVRIFPNNFLGMQVIERSPEIEQIARSFCEAGGRYTAQVLPDGKVEIAALIESTFSPGTIIGIRESEAKNDASLPECLDELVRRSAVYAGRVIN